MKEELQQKLLNSLDKVAEFVEQSKDFAAKEAPLVAQEIVNLRMIEGFLDLFLAFVCLVVVGICIKFALFCNKYIIKQKDEPGRTPDTPYVGLTISCILGAIFSLAFIFRTADAIYSFLQVHYTPRLLILEEIKNLM